VNTIKIFGYGSLLNFDSLLETSPDATNIQPVYIEGFKRSFNLWDSEGLGSESHGKLRGHPYCALDIAKIGDETVNGVSFEVNISLENLKKRENMYNLIETEAFDFNSKTSVGNVYVFSSNSNNGSYDFESVAQTRYLKMCLQGAKAMGDDFYQQFLATTYIENSNLLEYPELYE